MQAIGETVQDRQKSLLLKGFDPVSAHGFTQIPNFFLRRKDLSANAKVAFALLLSYAWNNNSCFPGQEKLAEDMGVTRRLVIRLLGELEKKGFLEKKRRGLGKTNVYILHSRVRPNQKKVPK